MALELHEDDLNTIIEQVFEKVKDASTSVEEVTTVTKTEYDNLVKVSVSEDDETYYNVDTISGAFTLPVLIYKTIEDEEGNVSIDTTDKYGQLRKLPISYWVDFIKTMKENADTVSAEFAKISADLLLLLETPTTGGKTIDDYITELNEIRAALNDLNTNIDNNNNWEYLNGTTSVFDSVIKTTLSNVTTDFVVKESDKDNYTDVPYDYAIDDTDFKVVYLLKNNVFAVAYTDGEGNPQYTTNFEDASKFQSDAATDSPKICKEKIYICTEKASLYVWNNKESKQFLTAISGSGSGSGSGFLNATTSEVITEKHNGGATDLTTALSYIWESSEDLGISDSTDYTAMKGMCLTYFDSTKGKYLDYQFMINGDITEDIFKNESNWVLIDGSNKVNNVTIGEVNKVVDENGNVSFTSADLKTIVTDNTLSEVVSNTNASANMPINSEAFNKATDKYALKGNLVNSLVALQAKNENGDTVYTVQLAYSTLDIDSETSTNDPSLIEGNEVTPIGNIITIQGGGGGSSSGLITLPQIKSTFLSSGSSSYNFKQASDLIVNFYIIDTDDMLDSSSENWTSSIESFAIKFDSEYITPDVIIGNGTAKLLAKTYTDEESGGTYTKYVYVNGNEVKEEIPLSALTSIIAVDGSASQNAQFTINKDIIEKVSSSSTIKIILKIKYLYKGDNESYSQYATKEHTSSCTANSLKLNICDLSISVYSPEKNDRAIWSSTDYYQLLIKNTVTNISNLLIYYDLNNQGMENASYKTSTNTNGIDTIILNLREGLNSVYVWCVGKNGTNVLNGNGIYFEIYNSMNTTDSAIMISDVVYDDYTTFYYYYDKYKVPVIEFTQYKATDSFDIYTFVKNINDTNLTINFYDTKGINDASTKISSTKGISIPTVSNSSASLKYSTFTNMFRTTSIEDSSNASYYTPQKMTIVRSGDVSRTIGYVVVANDFDITLPSQSKLIFDLRALGKSNEDTNHSDWSYGTYYTSFSNVAFNSVSGWNSNKLYLTGSSSIDIKEESGKISFGGSITDGGKTLQIKYSTKDISDDNYEFISISNTSGLSVNKLLSITPTSIYCGGTKLLSVAPNTDIDLIITSLTQEISNSTMTLTIMYLNGVLSTFSTTNYLSGNADSIHVGFNGTDPIPGTVMLSAVSFYNSLTPDIQALGLYGLNMTDNDEFNKLIDDNDCFDIKSQSDINSIQTLNNEYGSMLKYANDTYLNSGEITRTPYDEWLLSEDDLKKLPDGLRVCIVEGPNFTERQSNGLVNISSYATNILNGETINADIFDNLNNFDKTDKSTRIAASKFITYITGGKLYNSAGEFTSVGNSYNYLIERPSICDQGTSSMAYPIKNLRIYTKKKTKVMYNIDPLTYNDIDGEAQMCDANGNAQFYYFSLPKYVFNKKLELVSLDNVNDFTSYNPMATSGTIKIFDYSNFSCTLNSDLVSAINSTEGITLAKALHDYKDDIRLMLMPIAYGATQDYNCRLGGSDSNGWYDIIGPKIYNWKGTLGTDEEPYELLSQSSANGSKDIFGLTIFSSNNYGNKTLPSFVLCVKVTKNGTDRFVPDLTASDLSATDVDLFSSYNHFSIPLKYYTKTDGQISDWSWNTTYQRTQASASGDTQTFDASIFDNSLYSSWTQTVVPYATKFEEPTSNTAIDCYERDNEVFNMLNVKKLIKEFLDEYNDTIENNNTSNGCVFAPGKTWSKYDISLGLVHDPSTANGEEKSKDAKGKVQMTEDSWPAQAFTIKLDFMESSGTQNVGGAAFTNDVLYAVAPTPPQKAVNTKRKYQVRSSVRGQSGLLFSYSLNGWGEGDSTKKFRFRGKCIFLDDKTSEVVFGFDNSDYTDDYKLPSSLSNYAKERILKYWGITDTNDINYIVNGTGTPTSSLEQIKVYQDVLKEVDCGGVQCWEFSTSMGVDMHLNGNSTTSTTKIKDLLTIGGVSDRSDETKSYTYSVNVFDFDSTNNKNTYWVPNAQEVEGVTEEKTLGTFIPLSGTQNQIIKNGTDVDVSLNDLIWCSVEGEDGTPTLRPVWASAWELRYPDVSFDFTDWSNTAKSGETSIEPTSDDCEYFKINPIYFMTVYDWITSFYGQENNEDAQKRFREEVQYYFDVDNLLAYYVLTELMFACDQRVKNLMLAFYYVNDDLRTSDNTEFAKSGDYYTNVNDDPVLTDYTISSTSNSRTKKFGNMEGRRGYFIFYDCDTTLGLGNEGSLAYSWYADWDNTNIKGYGKYSTLWKMVKNSFGEVVDANNAYTYSFNSIWDDSTKGQGYFLSLRIMYDKIRNYINTKSVNSFDEYLSTNKKDSNDYITAGSNGSSSYTRMLDYYNKYVAELYPEQMYNKDAFYKYYTNTYRYNAAQGNRIEHKKWWIDNRLKYIDAKYNTGVISSVSTRLYSTISGVGMTIYGLCTKPDATNDDISINTNFYFNAKGYTTTKIVMSSSAINSAESADSIHDITWDVSDSGAAIKGYYWLEKLSLTVNTNSSTTNDTSGLASGFGSDSEPAKYLKEIIINSFAKKLFNTSSQLNVYYNDNLYGGRYKVLTYTYCTGLEKLHIYNEQPHHYIDFTKNININTIDIYNTYVNMIKFPDGCLIESLNVYLTPYDYNSDVVNSNGNHLKMILVMKNMPNFDLWNINWYDCKNSLPLLKNNFDANNTDSIKTFSGEDYIFQNIYGLYIQNCDMLQSNNIFEKINTYCKEHSTKMYTYITNVEITGTLSELHQYLQCDADGNPIADANGNYVPLVGKVDENGNVDDSICGISGNMYLTTTPSTADLKPYNLAFKNLNFIQPDFSYIKITNFKEMEDGTYFMLSEHPNKVSNESNQTGYEYSKQYKIDGHFEALLKRRAMVLAKLDASDTTNVNITKLTCTDGVIYSDNGTNLTSLEGLNGSKGDVMIFEPHYWYKGYTDWTDGSQYVIVSSSSDFTDITTLTSTPSISNIRKEINLCEYLTSSNAYVTNIGSSKYLDLHDSEIGEDGLEIADITSAVQLKTATTSNTSVYRIELTQISGGTENEFTNYFKQAYEESGEYVTHIGLPSKIYKNHSVAIGVAKSSNIKDVTIIKKVDNVFSNLYNSTTDAEYKQVSDNIEIGTADNYVIASLLINNDNDYDLCKFLCGETEYYKYNDQEYDKVYVFVNIDKNIINPHESLTIYEDDSTAQSGMIVKDVVLFKPQFKTFPQLDVYTWKEHKSVLVGMYPAALNESDSMLYSDDNCGGLVSISGSKQQRYHDSAVDAAKNGWYSGGQPLPLLTILECVKYKNNNSGNNDNTGFQHIDYEMQKHIYLIALAKYGNMNFKYVFGYRYKLPSNGAQTDAYVGYYLDSYETGKCNEIGLDSTTTTYRYMIENNLDQDFDTTTNYSIIGDETIKNGTVLTTTGDCEQFLPMNSKNKEMQVDKCMGYERFVTTNPTYWQETALCKKDVIAIKCDDYGYRVVGATTKRLTTNCWKGYQYRDTVSPTGSSLNILLNQVICPSMLLFGEYCDVLPSIYNEYSSYVLSLGGATSGTYALSSVVPNSNYCNYALINDKCVSGGINDKGIINSSSTKQSFYQGVDTSSYSTYLGFENSGPTNIGYMKRIGKMSDSEKTGYVSCRLAYRGLISVLSYEKYSQQNYAKSFTI